LKRVGYRAQALHHGAAHRDIDLGLAYQLFDRNAVDEQLLFCPLCCVLIAPMANSRAASAIPRKDAISGCRGRRKASLSARNGRERNRVGFSSSHAEHIPIILDVQPRRTARDQTAPVI
jgi:hypothetical protein